MSITNQSALAWIADEVHATLAGLDIDMAQLLLLKEASPEQYASLLTSCVEKMHSVAGAFELSGNEPLSRYSSALQKALQSWQALPNSLTEVTLTQVTIACHSLGDYLHTAKDGKIFAELSLSAQYQQLGEQQSSTFHPMDLWHSAERLLAIEAWSKPDALLRFQAYAQDRLSIQAPFVDSYKQADVLMLGLLRHQKSESVASLQTLCDQRIIHSTEMDQTLFAFLLYVVIQALEQEHLTLDINLKRYLLGSLAFLKGAKSEQLNLTNEAAFFCYVAWQHRQELGAESTNYQTDSSELNRLAELAGWEPIQGCQYVRSYFGQNQREEKRAALDAINQTQQLWDNFCVTEESIARQVQLPHIAHAIQTMGQTLELLHPAIYELNGTFKRILSTPKLIASRDLQIEVATTLLILRAMVIDTKSLNEADSDRHLADLNRRLTRVSNGGAPGAFEPWMLDLQQREGRVDAMFSSMEILGHKLTEIENIFKHLWANPTEMTALRVVPEKLDQISSVAHSLGLHDFVMAVGLVKEKISAVVLRQQAMDAAAQQDMTFELAALGLMLSMREHEPKWEGQAGLSITVEKPLPESSSAPNVAQSLPTEEDDQSIEQIFLMEAHEVFVQAHVALEQLTDRPTDAVAIAQLKRSFHTLKGSARIVGFMQFGDAAWLMEKHLNDSLLDDQAIQMPSRNLCAMQLVTMQAWVEQLQQQESMDLTAIEWRIDELTTAIKVAEQPPIFAFPPSDFLDLPATVDAHKRHQEHLESEPEPGPSPEKQLKSVGDLAISIPLYQAYLNESDEWSRQLALALSEWALDDRQPIPNQALAWSHALAGSSATIGFTGCADLAKAIELLIVRIQVEGLRSIDLAETISAAADEIRRLLHQFAAGFIKSPEPKLFDQLKAYLQHTMPVVEQTIEAPNIQMKGIPADDEMLAVFQEESAQLIPELGAALRAWQRAPGQQKYKAQALRVLHTLKGSARLVGEQILAQNVHELESLVEALGNKPSNEELSKLLAAYDQIAGKTQSPVVARAMPALAPAVAVVPVSSGETIRVQSSTVDRLVNQTGEIMIARSRMEAEMSRALRTLTDWGGNVQRLRDQLRELELQTESQMQSRQAQVSDAANSFDPLELDRFTRTQELTRFMAEALGDFTTLQRSLQRSLNATEDDLAAQLRQTRDLQRHLLRTRMVEFESIGERLHRLVRMTAQELGKSVQLTIQNSGQEIDRSVLERVLPAFEHLLRNAVVHGIEAPSERELKGKNGQGQIDIQLTQQSNDVIVMLRDDGRGIDVDALLIKAKKLAPLADLSVDPTELIFMSGLSTASEVSELAGRGIGLDVVRAQVQALGGRIEVHFAKDAGTTFKLILPLTTAVTQIVLVRTGALLTGVPGNLVVSVVRAKANDVALAQQSGRFISGTQTFPFHKLSQLLQSAAATTEPEQATVPIMLMQSAGQVIALQVDEVIGNQEVMIKNLGAQMAQLPGLSGMTILPTGPTVLIYNPVALATVYGPRVNAAQQSKFEDDLDTQSRGLDVNDEPKQPIVPLILVVDDSITMRRVLQRLLQREGYRVSLAADGKQALDSLRIERPALVLSDVEMPRMDGFELLQNIRASDRFRDLPVVMITSRIADKHREHAEALGANEYLGKPYSEEALIDVLGRYAKK